ncbi:MAG: hypothetical protein HOO87_04530 [Methyloglobulus sp.]|nr:hypothetical protein [Methyloglobulus sp.]
MVVVLCFIETAFYLKYHSYDKFFPLWALGRYRNEQLAAL